MSGKPNMNPTYALREKKYLIKYHVITASGEIPGDGSFHRALITWREKRKKDPLVFIEKITLKVEEVVIEDG
jgi:hypothetical protein